MRVLPHGADRFERHRCRIEREPIFLDHSTADLQNVTADLLGRTLSPPQKVEIASHAIGMVRPDAQEHRTLEDEALSRRRASEPGQEALRRIGGEQRLIVVTRRLRLPEQARENRRREVALSLPRHEMASRYGCITRLTRQMRA